MACAKYWSHVIILFHLKERIISLNKTWIYELIKRLRMMMSSNGNTFRVTCPLWGESTGHRWIPSQRPVTRTFDAFFDMCLGKRSNKQSRRRLFETPSCFMWHNCNDTKIWMKKVEAGNRGKYHEVNNKSRENSWCTVLIQYSNKIASSKRKLGCASAMHLF